jgi:hypothetical protein
MQQLPMPGLPDPELLGLAPSRREPLPEAEESAIPDAIEIAGVILDCFTAFAGS